MATSKMERTPIPGLMQLVKKLVVMSQKASVGRPECKMLAELMKGLIPLLTEIQQSMIPLKPSTVETFRHLMHALIHAEKVVKKMTDISKLKVFFLDTSLTEELRTAITEIQACVSSLPLVQLRISAEMGEEIKLLKVKLQDLGKNLKESQSLHKDQLDFAAEVTEVLRVHNTSEPSSSGGKANVMDKLILWLAQRFDSDVDTVRKEWQVMKDEVRSLKVQIQRTSENKRKLEDDLLQTFMFIDSQERLCTKCASADSGNQALATSAELEILRKEFVCAVCLNLFDDPVIIGSGFTYCRRCIMEWYEDNDTCPQTRTRMSTKTLIGNISMRNLVSKWKDVTQLGIATDVTEEEDDESDMSSQIYVVSDVNEDFVNKIIPTGTLEQPVNDDSHDAKGRSGLQPSTSQDSVNSLSTCLSLLGSNNKIQILKSLKGLTSIASSPDGQVQIVKAGGIRSINILLRDTDNRIAEKAAGVLEALTFEVQGIEGERTLSLEQREEICSKVIDIAIDNLILLMSQSGNKLGRIKAAQTVINMLGNEDFKAEIILRKGVVTAFYHLMHVGEGFLFPNEGKTLCIKGLNLLSGEKGTFSTEDTALAIALLNLSGLEASPEVVEEALNSLCLLLETGGEDIAHTLHINKAVPYLVQSLSRLPTGRGREEALKILNHVSSLQGLPESIVKHDLFSKLFPLLLEASDEGHCLTEGTRLLSTCLSRVKVDISLLLSRPNGVKNFSRLLVLEQTSAASKQDILSSLQYLCRESDGFRAAFLSSDGVATLKNLAMSTQIGPMKHGIVQVMKALSSFQSCHKDILRQEGLQLLYSLLAEGSLNSNVEAVFAAECLMTGQEGSTVSLDGFPFENVVDLLLSTNTPECREAATGVLNVFASKSSSASFQWDKKELVLLLNLVQPTDNLPINARKKAADALLNIIKRDDSCCAHLVEENGLQIVIEFVTSLGTDSTHMVIDLLAICCKGNNRCKQAVVEVGGVKLLLEALEKGRMKEESAIALENLLDSAPARQAVLQANFIEIAARCIFLNGGFQCSVDLTRALIKVTDSNANASKIRESDGVKALTYVLEGSSETGRRLAATALTKLIRFDSESARVLSNTEGIRLLFDLLTHRGPNTSECFDETEALEALSAASKEPANKIEFVKDDRIPVLLSILSTGDSRVQEMTLNVLLHLSRSVHPGEMLISSDEIWKTLISADTCVYLFDIVKPQSHMVTDKAIYSAISIIRNLSLAGGTARQAMLDKGDGVIKVVLDRIRCYDASSEIVGGAITALEKFMFDSKGRMAFIREGGIKDIAEVLQNGSSTDRAKSFATKIFVTIAKFSESQNSKGICENIFESNVVPGLSDILELAPDDDTKKQACILLKILLCKGPRVNVCKSIRDEGCIPKLLELKENQHCHQEASEVIDLLSKYDKEIKKLIYKAERQKPRNGSFIHGF